ncbi:MAG: DUF2520 domain-containing protein [Candidatus Kapabacteria bacterium]|nr:DUF2520 domain-containing protein [Candidatus Kapabacteria bacterium]
MSSDLLVHPPVAINQPLPHPLDFRVGIIGAGNVGTTLAMALAERSLLAWMVVRSAARRKELRFVMPDAVALYDSTANMYSLPDCIIVAVDDAEIGNVATELAQRFSEELEGVIIVHTSGALGREVLYPAAAFGARCIAAHPFETFPYPNTRALAGIAWGIETASPDDEQFASWFVRLLGGTPVPLGAEARVNKSLYHIAAVMASNYMYSLIAAAAQVTETVNLPAHTLLPPIIRTTVDNALLHLAHGSAPPLSGPVARGNVETVAAHIAALAATPALQRQYCYQGLATTEFALAQGIITRDQADGLQVELKKGIAD